MYGIDNSVTIFRLNGSKLRVDHDEWHDITIPLDVDASYIDCYWQSETIGKVDALELFASSHRVSAALAANGLVIGSPIDLRINFVNSREGPSYAKKTLFQQKPEVVIMTPRDSPWFEPEKVSYSHLSHMRDEQIGIVNYLVAVAGHQISQGKYFVLKFATWSCVWYTPVLESILSHNGVRQLPCNIAIYRGIEEKV